MAQPTYPSKPAAPRWRVERSERGSPGEFDWLENASAEELEAFIEAEP
jgi:hypothetical protein